MKDTQAEAKLFIYDLSNLAKEHWFKPGENWALNFANEAEKITLLKKYYPTLHISGETKTLTAIAEITQRELRLATVETATTDERSAVKLPAIYLIAYNPDRSENSLMLFQFRFHT